MPIAINKTTNIYKNNLSYLRRKIIPAIMFMNISWASKKCWEDDE